ncbi:hypothetical protein BSFA1_09900 [Burkholderia sp. SFA1]|nr:hypothetical protein BSFA1_09900 [Burkholderia sp. SFA1]
MRERQKKLRRAVRKPTNGPSFRAKKTLNRAMRGPYTKSFVRDCARGGANEADGVGQETKKRARDMPRAAVHNRQ